MPLFIFEPGRDFFAFNLFKPVNGIK